MKKVIFFVIILFLGGAKFSFSQDKKILHFGESFLVTVNGTYFFDKQNNYHRYNEYTLNVQVAVSTLKSLYVGFETFSIFTNGTNVNPNNYFLKGGFLRYNFITEKSGVIYASSNFLKGDYCTCGNLDPYRKENLNYIGFGLGANFFVKKSNFNFNASFVTHRILNEITLKSGYNLFKFGVGYRFGKKLEKKES